MSNNGLNSGIQVASAQSACSQSKYERLSTEIQRLTDVEHRIGSLIAKVQNCDPPPQAQSLEFASLAHLLCDASDEVAMRTSCAMSLLDDLDALLS